MVYLSNVDSTTAQEWTRPGSVCGNCHAIDAIEQRIGGQVGVAGDAGVANLSSGELDYLSASGKVTEATYAGSATIAQVYCTTCHAVTDQNDPHKTGIPWTPGSFPLYVRPDGGAVYIEKSPAAGAVTGMDAGFWGPSDTCMWCHKSLVDVTNYVTASNRMSTYWGPHEGPAADLFTGKGGYEYAGNTYVEIGPHQNNLSCVDCHMANVPGNSDVPDHTFAPNINTCTTSQCHGAQPPQNGFDIGGGQAAVEGLLTSIERAMNNLGWLTRGTGPLTDPDAGGGQVGDGNWNQDRAASVTLTAAQAGAMYNYFLCARAGGYGVHNPQYMKELLYDSYVAVTGNPPPGWASRP
jgi:hypothetical protein